MKPLLLFLAVALVLGIAFLATLYLTQERLIYFPRSYPGDHPALAGVEQVPFSVEGKRQVGFLLGDPGDGAPAPERVWWIFGGNGSVALDWYGLVSRARPGPGTAVILFDYPGYGFCEGRPHPERIQRSVDTLFSLLASRWDLASGDLAERSSALGHSLGAAVGLEAARRHEFPRAVGISPFTSMSEMARRQVGPLLGRFLRHDYDNVASLEGMAERTPSPEVLLFHGTADGLIPCAMSETLARSHPGMIELVLVPGAGHNDVIAPLEPTLSALLSNR